MVLCHSEKASSDSNCNQLTRHHQIVMRIHGERPFQSADFVQSSFQVLCTNRYSFVSHRVWRQTFGREFFRSRSQIREYVSQRHRSSDCDHNATRLVVSYYTKWYLKSIRRKRFKSYISNAYYNIN